MADDARQGDRAPADDVAAGDRGPADSVSAGDSAGGDGAATDTAAADSAPGDTSAGDAGPFLPVFATCGNGLCEPGETDACADCPGASGSCGDRTCNVGEDSNDCSTDCRDLILVDGAPVAPLPDLGSGRYKNYVGGLYPNGSNVPPADHLAAGVARALEIRPLDAAGLPSASGVIVMLSIGMSNTTQEFCHFDGVNNYLPASCQPWTVSGRWRDDAAAVHDDLVLINGARGGMSIENWTIPRAVPQTMGQCTPYSNPNNTTEYPSTPTGDAERLDVFGPNLVFDEEYDRINACQLRRHGYSSRQVQVVWAKLARMPAAMSGIPAGSLPAADADAYALKRDLGNVLRGLRARYPNLKLVFLSSRIWGGMAGSTAAEPYSYEGGFAVKWTIEAQINQMRNGGAPVEPVDVPGASGDLNYATGVAPWVGWGAYLWSNHGRATTGGAEWFSDVAARPYAGSLATESAAPVSQTLTLPPANGGISYVWCGPGTGSPEAASSPGAQQPALLNRWCESDFRTLLANGQPGSTAVPAPYGWGSDFRQEDGTHPTHDGEAKVGTAMHHFLMSSPVTRCWYAVGGNCP